MPLERAEMHTGAFVQVTAVWCLVCGSARCWCSALSTSSHRCSASRFCSLPGTAQRRRFLAAPLDDVRLVPVPRFPSRHVIDIHGCDHAPARSGSTSATATLSNPQPRGATHPLFGVEPLRRAPPPSSPSSRQRPWLTSSPRRRRAVTITLVDEPPVRRSEERRVGKAR